ncbi:MAG: peptide-methionine (S)-S-oxide reductase [Roseitalea sp.]|jgi:peptide-methionine (S)-S-oxide reductase|nr:peptide-methionine (S)-S-oxide reductase [Roseitalea sp.]MBO6723402.1 peptide-methionine (S)-S-oxide reductase [Roseitalea sp.]MBO6744804.1 peptide-methionine (S)-S-oxide reductase [Roseitalea sp.]
MTDHPIRIGFGGGCHWCTEAVFQALRGVTRVEQGFVRSEPPFDAWSEAVIVTFDPASIDLATLTEVHLRTHASTAAHAMRGEYRSAV